MDQVEAKLPESITYLELLSRMPGKAAPAQWVFAGRTEPWQCPNGPVAAWLRETKPTRLALPALSEAGAWEPFHHRVRA